MPKTTGTPAHSGGQPAPSGSLMRSLYAGTAGEGARLLATLVAGLLLTAGAGVMSYVVCEQPRGTWAPLGLLLTGAVYLLVPFWIRSRRRRDLAIWLATGMTVVHWLVMILLCALINMNMGFAADLRKLLTFGAISATGCLTLVGWMRTYRRYVGGRALYTRDGILALRCPACEYSMVGLKEARCPECGHVYTLDELVGQQDFDVLRLR